MEQSINPERLYFLHNTVAAGTEDTEAGADGESK